MEGAIVVGAASGNEEFFEVAFHGDDPADVGFNVELSCLVRWKLDVFEELKDKCLGCIPGGDCRVRHDGTRLVILITTTDEQSSTR